MVMKPSPVATALRSALIMSTVLATSTLGVHKTLDYIESAVIPKNFSGPPQGKTVTDNLRIYTSEKRPTNSGKSLVQNKLKRNLEVTEALAEHQGGNSITVKLGRQMRFKGRKKKSPESNWKKIQPKRLETKSTVRSRRNVQQFPYKDDQSGDLQVQEQIHSLSYASPFGFFGGLGDGLAGIGPALGNLGGDLSLSFQGGHGNRFSPLSAGISPSFLSNAAIPIALRPPMFPFSSSGRHLGDMPFQDFGQVNIGSFGTTNSFDHYKIRANPNALKGSDLLLQNEVNGRSNGFDVFQQSNQYQPAFETRINGPTASLLHVSKEDRLRQLEKEVKRELDIKDGQLTPQQQQTKAIYESIEGIIQEPHITTRTQGLHTIQPASGESLAIGSSFHEKKIKPDLENTSAKSSKAESLNFQAGGGPREDVFSPPAVTNIPFDDALNIYNHSQNNISQISSPISGNSNLVHFLLHSKPPQLITATIPPIKSTYNTHTFEHLISSTEPDTVLSPPDMLELNKGDNYEEKSNYNFQEEILQKNLTSTSTKYPYSPEPKENTFPNSIKYKLLESSRNYPLHHSLDTTIWFEKRPVPFGRPQLKHLPHSGNISISNEKISRPPPFGIPGTNKDHKKGLSAIPPLQQTRLNQSKENIQLIHSNFPISHLHSEDYQSHQDNLQPFLQSTGSPNTSELNCKPLKVSGSSVPQMSNGSLSTEASGTFRIPVTPNHHIRHEVINWYNERQGKPTQINLSSTEGTKFENKARPLSPPLTAMKNFESSTKASPYITKNPLDTASNIHTELGLQPLPTTNKIELTKLQSEEILSLPELKVPIQKPEFRFESHTNDETNYHPADISNSTKRFGNESYTSLTRTSSQNSKRDFINEQAAFPMNNSNKTKMIFRINKAHTEQTQIMISSPPPFVNIPLALNSYVLEKEVHNSTQNGKDITMLYSREKLSSTGNGTTELKQKGHDDIQVENIFELPSKYEFQGRNGKNPRSDWPKSSFASVHSFSSDTLTSQSFSTDFQGLHTSTDKTPPTTPFYPRNLSAIFTYKETIPANQLYTVKGTNNTVKSGKTSLYQDNLEIRVPDRARQNKGDVDPLISKNISPSSEGTSFKQTLGIEEVIHKQTDISKEEPLFRETVEVVTFAPLEKRTKETNLDRTIQTTTINNTLQRKPIQYSIKHHNTTHKSVHLFQRPLPTDTFSPHLPFPNLKEVTEQPTFHNDTYSVNSFLPTTESKTIELKNFSKDSKDVLHFLGPQSFPQFIRSHLFKQNHPKPYFPLSQFNHTRDHLRHSSGSVKEIPLSSFHVPTRSKENIGSQNDEVKEQKALTYESLGKDSIFSTTTGPNIHLDTNSKRVGNDGNQSTIVLSNIPLPWYGFKQKGSRPSIRPSAGQRPPEDGKVKLSNTNLLSSASAIHFEETSNNSRHSHILVSPRSPKGYNLPLNSPNISPFEFPNPLIISTENITNVPVDSPTSINDNIAKLESPKEVISEPEVYVFRYAPLQIPEITDSSSSIIIPELTLETHTEAPFQNTSDIMTQLSPPLLLSDLSIIHQPHRFYPSYTTPASSRNILPTTLLLSEQEQETVSLKNTIVVSNFSSSSSEITTLLSTSFETATIQPLHPSLVSPLISAKEEHTIISTDSHLPSATKYPLLLSELPSKTLSPVALSSDSTDDLFSDVSKELELQVSKPIFAYSPSNISSAMPSEFETQVEKHFGFKFFNASLDHTKTEIPELSNSQSPPAKDLNHSFAVTHSSKFYIPLSASHTSLSDLPKELSYSHYHNQSHIVRSSDISKQPSEPKAIFSDDKDTSIIPLFLSLLKLSGEIELSSNQDTSNITVHKPDSYPPNLNFSLSSALPTYTSSGTSAIPLQVQSSTVQQLDKKDLALTTPRGLLITTPSLFPRTKSSLLLSDDEKKRSVSFENFSDNVERQPLQQPFIKNLTIHQNQSIQVLASDSLLSTLKLDKNSQYSLNQTHYQEDPETSVTEQLKLSTKLHSHHKKDPKTILDENSDLTMPSTDQPQVLKIIQPQQEHLTVFVSKDTKQSMESVNHKIQLMPKLSRQHPVTDTEQNQHSQQIHLQPLELITPASQYSLKAQAVTSHEPSNLPQTINHTEIRHLSLANSISSHQQISKSLHSQYPKNLAIPSDSFQLLIEHNQQPQKSQKISQLQQESIYSNQQSTQPKPTIQSYKPSQDLTPEVKQPKNPSLQPRYAQHSLQIDNHEEITKAFHEREPLLPVTPEQASLQFMGNSYINQQQHSNPIKHNSLMPPRLRQRGFRTTTPKNQRHEKELGSRSHPESNKNSQLLFKPDNSSPELAPPERQYQLHTNRQFTRPSQQTQLTTRQNTLRRLRTRLKYPRKHSDTWSSQTSKVPTFHVIHTTNQTTVHPVDLVKAMNHNGQQQRPTRRRNLKFSVRRFLLGRYSENRTNSNPSKPNLSRSSPSAELRRMTARLAGFKNHAKDG